MKTSCSNAHWHIYNVFQHAISQASNFRMLECAAPCWDMDLPKALIFVMQSWPGAYATEMVPTLQLSISTTGHTRTTLQVLLHTNDWT